MASNRRVLRRFGTLAVVFAALTAPAAASAAVTFGQALPATAGCGVGVAFVQQSAPEYAAPSPGVITSWSTGATAPVKLKVFRQTTNASTFLTVGESDVQATGGLTRIPVEAGDRLGLIGPFGGFCLISRPGASVIFRGQPTDPPPGSEYVTNSTGGNLALSAAAVLEPDGDRDGFGDETQDGCPTSAATAGPCPPAIVAQAPPAGLNPGACSNEQRGSAAGETLNGTAAGDRLLGLAGNDTLNGLQGDDCLFGGDGRDTLSGAEGADRLQGDAGNDILGGGSGKDSLSGGAGNDKLTGASGDDTLSGGAGKDKLSGGTGNDRLTGGSGDDSLSGGQGKNRLSGGSGNDTINSVDGKRETVSCGGGRDTVRADRSDSLRGCERSLRLR